MSQLVTTPGPTSGNRDVRPRAPEARDQTQPPHPGETTSPRTGRLSTARLAAVLAALLLLLPVAAALLSAAQPPTYAAQVDVLYRGSETTGSSIERELATQQVVLQSRSLIDEAAATAGREPKDLVDDVSVEVVEESNVLRLLVEDHDPERAQEIAQSLVDQYIAAVREQAAASTTSAQERTLLQGQIDERTARLEAIAARVAEIVELPAPSAALETEQRNLDAEAQVIRQRLVELQAQLLDADVRALREGVGRAQVLAAPAVLDEPVGPQPLRAAAAGALTGLVLVVALLALLRLRHERSRQPTP